jgi:hypothetical protein
MRAVLADVSGQELAIVDLPDMTKPPAGVIANVMFAAAGKGFVVIMDSASGMREARPVIARVEFCRYDADERTPGAGGRLEYRASKPLPQDAALDVVRCPCGEGSKFLVAGRCARCHSAARQFGAAIAEITADERRGGAFAYGAR